MSDVPRVWLLEDDASCQEIVREALQGRCTLRTFSSLREFQAAAAENEAVDLVIADVRLPDASFVVWLDTDEAQALLVRVPFLVVSSVDDVDVITQAFHGGAVDFLSKPFGRAELQVKVERALRATRPGQPSGTTRAARSVLELDAFAMTVRRAGGDPVPLTAKEMQLLALLWNAPGGKMPRDALYDALWGGCHVGRKTLDVHLSRLRRKLLAIGLDVRALPSNTVALVTDAGPA